MQPEGYGRDNFVSAIISGDQENPTLAGASARIRASRPSSRPRPAHPTGVVTTARPQAIASITLILVPAETSSGTAATVARVYSGRRSSTNP